MPKFKLEGREAYEWRMWFENEVRNGVDPVEICRHQLEANIESRKLAKDDPAVGTCDMCGESLGYVIEKMEDHSGNLTFSPVIDEKTYKPKPSEGWNPRPFRDADKRCCLECNLTEVIPTRYGMAEATRH